MSHQIYENRIQFDNQIGDITEFKNSDATTAQYIHDNYSRMDEIERLQILKRILHEKTVSAYLLKYELQNLDTGIRYTRLPEFVRFMDRALTRYHMWAGGQLCEDTEWTKYTHTSNKYPLGVNEIVYENSTKKIYRHSIDTAEYIADLLRFFDRHHTDDIRVRFKMIAYTDEIYLMIFIVKQL